MTPELKKFLTDWYKWVIKGAPDQKPFTRNHGLCLNLLYSFKHKNVESDDLYDELYEVLRQDYGFDCNYPFGGKIRYNREHYREEQHLNPHRLAWVRGKLRV